LQHNALSLAQSPRTFRLRDLQLSLFAWSQLPILIFAFPTPCLSIEERTYSERIAALCSQWSSSMTKTLTLHQTAKSNVRARDYIVPAAVALACAGAAYAGADTTFDPALQKFTDFLEGSGGKIITVLSLAGGLIALASGRFALGQVAVPVGVGIGVGTGVPIVTSVVTATI
jgi:hypothetical protein